MTDQDARVCLVSMPYASIERPSIALSILKSALARAGIRSTILYGNIQFAEEIGAPIHDLVCKTQSHSLAGEWTFASAAFPEFEPDEDAYFAHVGTLLLLLLPLLRRHGGRGQLRGILGRIRRHTPGFIDRVARRVLATGPSIVGCSSTFQQHCASLALLRRIKELSPDVVTVIGGANCEATMGVVTHKECPWVDYVVSGEAEDAFTALCQRLLGQPRAGSRGGPSRRSLLAPDASAIGGVIGPECRGDGGERHARLLEAPPRARLEDMSRSPTPDYDEYFEAVSRSPIGHFIEPGLLAETSRGCWWGAVSHCTFCGLNGTSMAFRAKKPEQVVEELAYLSTRHRLTSVEIVDNILDLSYLKTVLPALEERNEGYDIFYETKANLSRDHLRQMAAAGVRWLQPGIETLDDGLLRAIAKGTTARQNLQLMKWAREYGMYVLWILLYDIPGETDEPYAKMAGWLPLISHLQPPSGISYVQYNRFSPYHSRPAEFDLHIEPDRSYSFVYPWSRASLDDFAYFFDDYTRERDQIGPLSPRRPGLGQIRSVLSDWQQSWIGRMDAARNESETATLVMTSHEGRVEIADTRPCRVRPEHTLEGLAAAVYQACDRARRAEGLLDELAAAGAQRRSWEEVGPVVRELCASKLMLDLDGWYLSLAVRGPLAPLPNISKYPGGRLRTAEQAELARLRSHAESYLAAAFGLRR